MELSEYTLETLRNDGESSFIGATTTPNRRESTVLSRDDTRLGTARTGSSGK